MLDQVRVQDERKPIDARQVNHETTASNGRQKDTYNALIGDGGEV